MGQSTARDPGTNSSTAAKTNTALFARYWGTDRAEGRGAKEMRGEGKERREKERGEERPREEERGKVDRKWMPCISLNQVHFFLYSFSLWEHNVL